ncbi:MAG: ketoacyl-ACP synthase III [Candidatus Aureabacteria bacterium]|nr:ketoacyl-ACP synthase III [Candidatus Auribacterota bacterium]
MNKKTARILATGAYLPDKVLTNKDLENMVDTSDDWITTRTGIKERRIAAEDQSTSDMGVIAAERAIKKSGLDKTNIDAIIVATITPDMFFPSTACFIQRKLGLTHIPCFDISAACTGYIFSLVTAAQFLKTGAFKNILVVAAEKMSAITDWEDRATCVLFGDGAGAAVVSEEKGSMEIGQFFLGSDGRCTDILNIPAGGSFCPASEETVKKRLHFTKMTGQDVFKHAVRYMTESAENVLKKSGLKIEDIDCLLPHQANIRIITAVAKRLGIPEEKVYLNVHECGNMSAASSSVGLDGILSQQKDVKRILMVAFGAGLTYGALLLQKLGEKNG